MIFIVRLYKSFLIKKQTGFQGKASSLKISYSLISHGVNIRKPKKRKIKIIKIRTNPNTNLKKLEFWNRLIIR